MDRQESQDTEPIQWLQDDDKTEPQEDQAVAFAIAGKFCRKRPFAKNFPRRDQNFGHFIPKTIRRR